MRSFNFFELPRDLAQLLLKQWFNTQSPMVVLVNGEPSQEQQESVLAGSGPRLNYDRKEGAFYTDAQEKRFMEKLPPRDVPKLGITKVPDLGVYHLIANYSDAEAKIIYRIGFCRQAKNGALIYETKILGDKSPLLRYVQENHPLEAPQYSTLFPYDPKTEMQKLSCQDPILVKYMELEIKAAGGLIRDSFENFARIYEMCPQDFNRTNSRNYSLYKNMLKQAMLEKLLHHIAYGEEKEALALIQKDITLLESGNKAAVTLCAPEMVCPETCVLDLVVLLSDWYLWRKIVEAINASNLSEKEKQYYKDNFLARMEAVENYGVKVIFDNLLNKGIQILDADLLNNNDSERRRYETDVVSRGSYHLIIQTVKENEKRRVILCELGFKDPQNGGYRKIIIPAEHELFKVAALELYEDLKTANNGHDVRHAHFITRANRELFLMREILEKEGVKTRGEQTQYISDFKCLLEYFEKRIHGYDHENWSDDRFREQWCREICAELRICSPLFLQYWFSAENPWSLNEGEVSRFINSPARPVGVKNYYDDPILPLSSSLGDRFAARGGRGERAGGFIKIYRDSRVARSEELKDVLAGRCDFDVRQNACCLM